MSSLEQTEERELAVLFFKINRDLSVTYTERNGQPLKLEHIEHLGKIGRFVLPVNKDKICVRGYRGKANTLLFYINAQAKNGEEHPGFYTFIIRK